MQWSRLFATRRNDDKPAAATLYRAIVVQARQPAFFVTYGVPDTLDGRFDLIALHMFLVLHRLKQDGRAAGLSQVVFDTMFEDMDRSLREMGVGDLGVGRRVRAMGEALYGRLAAYEAGLDAGDTELSAALRRNLYGTVEEALLPASTLMALCGYVRQAARGLAGQSLDALRTGKVTFPEVPSV